MNKDRDNYYSRLYRTMQAGEELIVTDESGLIVVRFRFLKSKAQERADRDHRSPHLRHQPLPQTARKLSD